MRTVEKAQLWRGVWLLAVVVSLWGCSNGQGAADQGAVEQGAIDQGAIDQSVTDQGPIIADSEESSLDPSVLAQRSAADNESVLSAIAPSQVVYLAETHNDLADHEAQLSIIQTLSEQGDIAIGLEMFQRPFQSALDDYLAGGSEAELIAASEYETRWGFDWEFYAPILRYAKENSIPLIALNTPAEITRKVAQTGLDSLEGDDLRYIPPVADVDLSDADYRAWLSEIFNARGGAGHSLDFENFFAAQVLWDETMAERIVQQLEAQPDTQVVVLVGEGHVLDDYGIPDRVERRFPDVSQSSVRLTPSEQTTPPDAIDFVWITD